jgi:hypothetical protein
MSAMMYFPRPSLRDFFEADDLLKNTPVIGPDKKGAQLEGSKDFSKKFMARHNIPTAKYATFTKENIKDGYGFLELMKPPYVLKADGLAAGKGVLICQSYEEAESMVIEANSDISDFVSRLADEVYDITQSNYSASDLEGFVGSGPLQVVAGYYADYTLIVKFDDYNIGGLNEVDEAFYKETITQYVLGKMEQIANELGLVKVKSGGWTGPIIVEEGY